MQNGVTNPFRCSLDDDTQVVVKFFNNEQGNLSLVNEYICYKLAIEIGLPMPISGICLCDHFTIDKNNDLMEKNYGYGFYSTYIEKNVLLKPGIMKHISNLNLFYGLVIFDHFVYNKDRNLANLLVEFSKKRIFISVIDHSHVFKNETIWDKNCFDIGIKENDYQDTIIMKNNFGIYEMFIQSMNIQYDMLIETAHYIQSKLSDEKIERIVFDIPHQWGVSNASLCALKEYLIYRRNHLEDICKVIYDYIQG